MTRTLPSPCVSHEYHAFLLLLWHWTTQKALSHGEILLLAIMYIVSAYVRRQMPCSLPTPLSGHLFYHSSKVHVSSVSLPANFVCCVQFDLASRPPPKSIQGQALSLIWLERVPAGSFWVEHERNKVLIDIFIASTVYHCLCVIEADIFITQHQSFRHSIIKPCSHS